MSVNFEGQTIVVTGGASGIGDAITRKFAEAGAFVVIADVQLDRGQALAASLGAEQAMFVRTDVGDEQSIAACVEAALSARGRVDCAVNNAGIFDPAPGTEAITADHARRLFDVLLLGPMLMTRQLIPAMKRQGGGVIINTTSVTGLAPSGATPVYGPLKAGLIHWTRCTALELAEHGIRMNAVCPGGILTPMMLAAFQLDAQDEAAFNQAKANMDRAQPLQRAGQPTDIASAVLFLASEEAGWITGHNLVVDGGWSLAPGRGQS